jgi:hypoxanthine phosphoribosyltransferase
MSVEKATSYLQSKGKLAEVCAEKFPIQERVIEGQTIVVIDTLTVAGDSVACAPSPVPKKVKCPDAKVQVKHSFRVDTLVQENTAKVEMYKGYYLQEKVLKEQVQEKLSVMTDSRDKWRSRCIGLLISIGAVVGVGLFFKFYLP